MEVAKQAKVKILWNKKDVTSDVSKYISSVEYSDHEEGMSDEATFVFENTTAIWSNDWYPTEGDTIELFIGYNDNLLNCGLFQVDEITISGMPDIIEMKTLAAGITKALRTRNNKAFEDLSLKQIANFFCNKHGLKLVDTSSMLGMVNLDRKTQENKTDLQFLSELAQEYGFIFSIRGNQLIFMSYHDLDNAKSVKELDKTEVGNYSITQKTYNTYASAEFIARNKKKGKVVKSEIIALEIKGDNILKVKGDAKKGSQATAKVKAGIWEKNRFKQTCRIGSLQGDPSLVAGVNIDLTGFGVASAKYHITSSSHSISGDGAYLMNLELRKTGDIPKPKRIPKKVAKKKKGSAAKLPELLALDKKPT